MNSKKGTSKQGGSLITRRSLVKGLGAAAGAAAASGLLPTPMRYIQVQAAEPIKIGFQVHRTGIGAAYGRWYERTTRAAVAEINAKGGIAGRRVEIIFEDGGTDPKRGADVVDKFAAGPTQSDVPVTPVIIRSARRK